MDAFQTVAVCKAAPGSKVIAVYMDSVDHATVSRQDLRTYAANRSVDPGQLLIPADMEEYIFEKKKTAELA